MSRLTVRLPDSLHQTLTRTAQDEGVSLNQLIVYLLTRMTAVTDVEAQRTKFEELRSRYSEEEAEGALQELLASRVPASSQA